MEIYTAKLVDGFRSILSLFIFSLFVLKMKKNIFASWAEAQVLFGRIVVFMFSLLMFDSSPSDVMSWMLVMPTLTFTRWRQICFCCSASVPHTHTHTRQLLFHVGWIFLWYTHLVLSFFLISPATFCSDTVILSSAAEEITERPDSKCCRRVVPLSF